jgi:hypothetical protein
MTASTSLSSDAVEESSRSPHLTSSGGRGTPRTRLAGCIAAFVGYAASFTFLTWPLIPNAATHLPKTAYGCGFDNLYSGWTLAHQSRALIGATPLADGGIFHPAPDTLYYGPLATGALPYFAPVFLATGNPTLALNAVFALSIVLTAWTLHLVAWRWTSSHVAGAISGAAYLFTPWILWEWLPTAPHWAVLQYMPLIAFVVAERRTGMRAALALLGLVVLQCLTDLVYVGPALLAPLAVLGAARVARASSRRSGIVLLAVVAITALLLLVPARGYLRVQAANPDLERQTFWPIDADFFRRFAMPLPRGLLFRNVPTAVPTAALWLIGAGAVSCAAGRRRRQSAAWSTAGLWVAVGTFLSLTPTVRWGDRLIDLPQAWAAKWVPLFAHVRVPSRLGVTALIGLALLAGLAFGEIAARIAALSSLRRAAPGLNAALGAALLVAMYLQYQARIPAPVDGQRYKVAPAVRPDGPLMDRLRSPGGPLIELPAQLQPAETAPLRHAEAMYRSIFHSRRILNGYASYWPAGFAERMALAAHIPASAVLADLRRQTGLELFWLHGDALTPASRMRWLDLAERGGRADLRLVARDGNELLFAVGDSTPLP